MDDFKVGRIVDKGFERIAEELDQVGGTDAEVLKALEDWPDVHDYYFQWIAGDL